MEIDRNVEGVEIVQVGNGQNIESIAHHLIDHDYI